MLFLLVAMTYINAMEERRLFEWLREKLIASGLGLRSLFWLTGILAFFISPNPGMTESEIEVIIDQAKSRWPLEKVTVIHRVGRMLPTENIVFVGCSSAHRGAAFDGANFIMDFLKTKAPFWKLEDGPDGAKWVDQMKAVLRQALATLSVG